MCKAYAAIGLPLIVRIPALDPFAATMAIDGGAAGVVAPYMETLDYVRALRGAVKKRPTKGRKLDGILAGEVVEPDLERFMNKGANERLLIINIESVSAIEALDDILSVPDLDGLLIGPHDFSSNLGVLEQYEQPDFIEACSTVFRKARAAGIGAGIHFWGEPKQQVRFLENGSNMLIHSVDILLFQQHLSLDLKAIWKAADLGDGEDPQPNSDTIEVI